MAKAIAPRGPSKAQQAKEDRRWRAESLVKDKITTTPAFKKEVTRVERELAKVEKSVQVPKKGKK